MAYTLQPATPTTLGGIKVGKNLEIEKDGTLNAVGIDLLNETLDKATQNLETGKNMLAVSITNKGVTTQATDTLETMAKNVNNIPVGASVGVVTGTSIDVTSSINTNMAGGEYIASQEL